MVFRPEAGAEYLRVLAYDTVQAIQSRYKSLFVESE